MKDLNLSKIGPILTSSNEIFTSSVNRASGDALDVENFKVTVNRGMCEVSADGRPIFRRGDAPPGHPVCGEDNLILYVVSGTRAHANRARNPARELEK